MAQAPTASPSAGTAHKWVYLFEEGNADRNLLGGKGAGCAGMTKAGLPVPPGFTITTEACVAYYSTQQSVPGRHVGADARGARDRRAEDGQEAGRPERPAARLGPLRRARLDAGHDGHRAEPRPERHERRGIWRS